MKKVLSLVLLLVVGAFLVSGCEKKVTTIKMSAEEIVETLYNGLTPGENMPAVANLELDKETMASFVGKSYDVKEAVASDALMTAQAHSVVVIKVKDTKDLKNMANEIEKAAKDELFRKWICVEAETVKVYTKGDVIVLAMTTADIQKTIEKNIDSVK